VLYTFGTQAQKQRYLPKIATADEFWCQGFSEPNAGSDVMSLKTVAKPIGDDFLVTGQKLWTSNAHVADMMFALVRIDAPDAKRLRGLSFLLIDMKSPGIKVRPVITIDGRHIVNEVALENVRVPGANLVGERGKGWEYARFLLANERTKAAGVAVVKRQVGLIRSLLKSERAVGRALAENAVYRSKLAQFEAELRALEFMELRLLSSRADQVQILAPMLKLRGSELKQRLSEFALELLGERALESPVEESQPLPVEGSALSAHAVRQCTSVFLYLRSATIVGGTSEIQRNIIAGMALGL
jgi:alkylation response protein AidB-like acyl-CoA dehydrogenase